MTEYTPIAADPRWGQEGRNGKAEAILATLRLHCSRDLTSGLWLDIGCGSGGIAAALAKHVEQVVGVDPEPWERWKSFQRERLNLAFHMGSYPDLVALVGAETVDVAVCNQVYEHVDDPAAMLRAIHRVMKPGGICYFAGPNLLWPIEPHVFWPFVHWLPRQFAIRLMNFFRAKRVGYLDAWSMHYWALKRLFRRAGFISANAIHDRIKAQTQRVDRVAVRSIVRLSRPVVSVFTPLAPGFVFVLTKPRTKNRNDL
jgi:SAM-dependent methyltransferase